MECFLMPNRDKVQVFFTFRASQKYMKRFLLLFLIIPLLSFQGMHKFYVSVTDIEYNPETKSLQLISRIFIDDMENLLKTRYSKELYLTKNEEHPEADAYLKKYLSQKLKVEVNGKTHSLKYLGKKYENDILKLFIEIENVGIPEQVLVQNEILTDLFSDQKNVVHVEVDGVTKSLLLSRSNESGLLNFSK